MATDAMGETMIGLVTSDDTSRIARVPGYPRDRSETWRKPTLHRMECRDLRFDKRHFRNIICIALFE